ncbi:KAP family P-loop NTPase fold protein [Priestia aryabhattai]|uniref:KAP family P-loop NTPase fold protein n=1 Tax=Priestia aryabhattai TaxID=412384 RepID=UPI00203C9BD7|nr:P-loop NTPase fold protein [Priestia aryabhattai]MCM3252545.1 KAP family NTPase [Priestia aryabhattai]
MWKDSETELDYLDFDHMISLLQELISDESLLPSSIGVYGDWGSGKSSLIRMSMKKAEEVEGTVCLIFNGWLFEGYEDAKTALMGNILDAIQEHSTLSDKAKKCISGLYKSVDKLKLIKNGIKYTGDFLLTGGLGTITSMTIQSILANTKERAPDLLKGMNESDLTSVVDSIKGELNNKEIREDIKAFQKNFAELLAETKINRLVVFIDELDRCSPETILETLEAIRLFLFTGNTVFIIGADERHISYAVQKKFDEIEGQQINIGKEYLEKIIQYPIRIPRLSHKEMEFYINCLLFEKDLSKPEFEKIIQYMQIKKEENFLEFELTYELIANEHPELAEKIKESLLVAIQLSDVLAQGLNGNPRHCKRFLNSLVMREKMSEYKHIDLDRKVLAKIMLLEYFKPSLFKKIAELQSMESGKPNDLRLLEMDELDEENGLKIWKDDKWVQRWCELNPPLRDVDLRGYFYFSRDSLIEKNSTFSKKLSPKAHDVYQKLLSKGEVHRNKAIEDALEINDYEATAILQRLFASMVSESNIDKNLLKSYLGLGKTRNTLYSQVLNDLSSLPGQKIVLNMVPIICSFIKDTKQEVSFESIQKKWSQDNPKIERALETNLKKE